MNVIKMIDIFRAKKNAEWTKQSNIYGQGNLTKYYKKWVDTQKDGRTPLSEEIPWISFEAITYLERCLKKHMAVFEYGSGGSTVFFARRVKHVTSIEHDERWFERVSEAMTERRLLNWAGQCIAAEPGSVGQGRPEYPPDYTSADFNDRNFKSYVTAIDEQPDGSFDLVLVDGRARPSCIIHALPKIKAGGYLVLDNADRSYYTALTENSINKAFDPVLDRRGPFPFVPEFLKTTIWKKRP